MGLFTSAETAYVEDIMEKENERAVNEKAPYDDEVATNKRVQDESVERLLTFGVGLIKVVTAATRLVCILIMKIFVDLRQKVVTATLPTH